MLLQPIHSFYLFTLLRGTSSSGNRWSMITFRLALAHHLHTKHFEDLAYIAATGSFYYQNIYFLQHWKLREANGQCMSAVR